MINFRTKTIINTYIEDNPDSKCNVSAYALLEGKIKSLDTYRLPVNIVYYSIQNGRFASEYREACQSHRKEKLDSTETNDIKIIEELLYSPNNDALKEDLMQMGQKEPGIITCDGFVINANRRLLCLKKLSKENSTYGYINVGMLPETVSDVDLWKIEADLQLSKASKLDYGPINTLLKIRDGIAKGLNSEQLSSLLFGYTKKEIDELLERLKLNELYLDYVGYPNMYSKLKGINEHFVDYQSILKKHQNTLNEDELDKINAIVFELINDNITHLKLRKIKMVLSKDQSTSKFFEAYVCTRQGSPDKKVLINALKILVDHSIDRYEVVKRSDLKPILTKIKNMIVVIKKDNEGLSVDENRTLLLEIKEHIENLIPQEE